MAPPRASSTSSCYPGVVEQGSQICLISFRVGFPLLPIAKPTGYAHLGMDARVYMKSGLPTSPPPPSMFAWFDTLCTDIVGMRGSMVIRLRPRINLNSTPSPAAANMFSSYPYRSTRLVASTFSSEEPDNCSLGVFGCPPVAVVRICLSRTAWAAGARVCLAGVRNTHCFRGYPTSPKPYPQTPANNPKSLGMSRKIWAWIPMKGARRMLS